MANTEPYETVLADHASAVVAVTAYRDAAIAKVTGLAATVKAREFSGDNAYKAQVCIRAADEANAALVALLDEGNAARAPKQLISQRT